MVGSHPTENRGALFLNPQPLILSGQEWQVVIDLNVTQIVTSVRDSNCMVHHLRGDLKQLSTSHPAFGAMLQEVQSIALAAQDMEAMAWEIEEYLPRQRDRRGLINAGGKVLNFLFGTPDADDFEAVRRGVDTAQQDQGRLVYVAKEQLIVTCTLGDRVCESAHQVQTLAWGMVNLTLSMLKQ
ncbi:hypothetical protein GE061_001410 [Apolygus lucorum]|uniref:Uncharacterized protein n=1 Tax=Apolygus lucorum TaxID=248454 RepID=A0A6A4ISN0_APOLU|nr:hypothetical protein GE061_001410 [Apolygus lucorum]